MRMFVLAWMCSFLALTQTTGQEKQDAHYWAKEGYKHVQKNELAEAEKCYKKSLELKPGDAYVHGNLTVVYLRTKRYPELIKSADEAIRLGNKFAGVYLNRAQAYRWLAEKEPDKKKQMELYEGAIGDCDKVINYKSNNLKLSDKGEIAYAHAILSVSYNGLGQQEKAKTHYDKAIELDPKLKDQ